MGATLENKSEQERDDQQAHELSGKNEGWAAHHRRQATHYRRAGWVEVRRCFRARRCISGAAWIGPGPASGTRRVDSRPLKFTRPIVDKQWEQLWARKRNRLPTKSPVRALRGSRFWPLTRA